MIVGGMVVPVMILATSVEAVATVEVPTTITMLIVLAGTVVGTMVVPATVVV